MADLTEKRHDSVKRTIDTLAKNGVIDLPPPGEYLDSLGRPAHEYRIGKRDTRAMLAELGKDVLTFEGIYFDSYNRALIRLKYV